jgi:alkylmercury lyase
MLMVSLPYLSALVMRGSVRVAFSQSKHTCAWEERKGLWRRYIQGNEEPFTNGLELLFSLELHYQGPIELAPIGEKVGTLVGGGDGTLSGPRVRGTVRWSNYETTGEDQVCALQVPGIIQTHDGALVQFEGRELAMPLSDESTQWRVAGVLRFKTDDSRYVWLNDTFALTSGMFDYEAGLAHWTAFVPKEGRRLEHLARALREAGIRQSFTPDVSLLTVRLWREIARGVPVSPEQVEQLASALDLEQQTVHEVLHKMCERDEDGNVVGIAGLSQNQHPHRFTVNGIQLATWCAWDSLFLPVMLQQTAEVASSCPSTGETIRLTITPEGVTSYQPESAVISIVIPQPRTSGPESVEEIWTTFCHHVHFFSSPQAAQEWVDTRDQEVAILTIEEAFELGRLTLSEVLRYI